MRRSARRRWPFSGNDTASWRRPVRWRSLCSRTLDARPVTRDLPFATLVLRLLSPFPERSVRTALYDEHLKLNAKIVDFHGWDMPIQYSNIIEEHTAVRTKVGLFDLSHMGRIWVRGKDRKP